MKNNNEIQIQFVPIELLEYNNGQIPGIPENPRTREDTKQRNLEKSIEELPEMTIARAALCFPYNGRFVVIGGNRRLEAQRALKRKEVPIIALPEDTPVEKIRRMALLDNESTGQTDWAKLAKDWSKDEIRAWHIETPKGWFNEAPGKKAEEDNYTAPERLKPRVKHSEIWQLGEHRLMCGDSTNKDDVIRLMNGEKGDLILTDPPSGNNIGSGRGLLGERRILNDENTNVLEKMYLPIDSVLKNNTHCLVWTQWRTFADLVKAFKNYKLRTVVIWDKMQAGLSGGGFAEQYEMLCVFIKGKAAQNEYCGNVWQCGRTHEKRKDSEHPHKKPIEILAKAIRLCSKEKDLVVDVFGGSGSTLIACEQLNRKCYMMELSEHCCDVIINRWETLTGHKAVKIG